MNYADSARIKAILTNSGRNYVETIEQANVIIIDTCSVRQKSEDKVTGKLQEIPRDKKIWITWCMIQHNLRNNKIAKAVKDNSASLKIQKGNFIGNVTTLTPRILWRNNEEMETISTLSPLEGGVLYVNHAFNPMFFNINQSFPNVELFFRIDDTGLLPLMMQQLWYEVSPDPQLYNEYTGIIPHSTNQLFKENTKTAYVPISTWCSQFCAYCIVPYARGLEKNLDPEKVIAEAQHHISNGVEEIVLLGQIVNKHPQFVDICKAILQITWLRRLRYTSPYPNFFSPELLELHENEEKMCPHIHMPLQSGSNTILQKMFRWYTAEQYKDFVNNIRTLNRPISITSDIIIGFSDESEEDFQKSLELAQDSQFDMIYMGIYSPRPWTLADKKYQDNISKQTKTERRTRLNALLTEISWQNNTTEIWSTREIIINKITDQYMSGYTDNMKNVIIKIDQHTINPQDYQVGQFSKVTIIWSEPFKLLAKRAN